MNARMLLGALAALGITGCSGASVNDRISAQTEYDFTVADDRAQFQEQGLAFRGSVGPFAVYQVTAADPKLVGPFVQPEQVVGYAMLCGAAKYFLPLDGQADVAAMSLHGGRTGTLELVTTDQQPAHDGECAPPKDTFGQPLPDGGSGGSDDMGPTVPPVFTPPGDQPDMTLVFNPPPGGELPVVQSLQVQFDPAPAPGSTVLIRRVALTNERQHNGSHVIPNICCKGGECSLGPVQ
jgi:hypothetical protein